MAVVTHTDGIKSMQSFDPQFRRTLVLIQEVEGLAGRMITGLISAPIDPASKEMFVAALRALQAVAPALVDAERITKRVDEVKWDEFVYNPKYKDMSAWTNKA